MAKVIEYSDIISDSVLKGLENLQKQFSLLDKTITDLSKNAVKSTETNGKGYIENQQNITILNETLLEKQKIEENNLKLEKLRLQLEKEQIKLNKEKNKGIEESIINETELNNILTKEVKTIKEAEEQNKELRKTRKLINTETEEGKNQIIEINKVIDKNNELIKNNNDLLGKQKINIGNYKSAISGLEDEIKKLIVKEKELAVSVGKESKEYKDLQTELNQTINSYKQLNIQQNEIDNSFKSITTNVHNSNLSFKEVFGGVTAANLLQNGIQKLGEEFKRQLENIKAFETAASEIVNLGYTQDALKEKAIELSNATGIAATDILKSYKDIGIEATATLYTQQTSAETLTNSINKLTASYNNLFLSGATDSGISETLKGLVDFGTEAINTAKNSKDLINLFDNLTGIFKDVWQILTDLFSVFDTGNDKISVFEGILKVLTTTTNLAIAPLRLVLQVVEWLVDAFQWVGEKIGNLTDKIKEIVLNSEFLTNVFGKVKDAINFMIEPYKIAIEKVKQFLEYTGILSNQVDALLAKTGEKQITNWRKIAKEAEISSEVIVESNDDITTSFEDVTTAIEVLNDTELDIIPEVKRKEIEKGIESIDEKLKSLQSTLQKAGEGTFLDKLKDPDLQDAIVNLTENLGDLFNGLLENSINANEKLIEDRQTTIDTLTTQIEDAEELDKQKQEQGIARDTEELTRLKAKKAEEEKILLAQKEKQKRILKLQLGVQLAADQASAISSLIVESGKLGAITGNPIVPVLNYAARIVSILAAFANAKGKLDEINAYADGTERVSGPGSERSDSINAKLSKNERVVPAKINREIGFQVKNKDLPMLIRAGQFALNGGLTENNFDTSEIVKEQRITNKLLTKNKSNFTRIKI